MLMHNYQNLVRKEFPKGSNQRYSSFLRLKTAPETHLILNLLRLTRSSLTMVVPDCLPVSVNAGVLRHRPPHGGPVQQSDRGVREAGGVAARDRLALRSVARPDALSVAKAGRVAWKNKRLSYVGGGILVSLSIFLILPHNSRLCPLSFPSLHVSFSPILFLLFNSFLILHFPFLSPSSFSTISFPLSSHSLSLPLSPLSPLYLFPNSSLSIF